MVLGGVRLHDQGLYVYLATRLCGSALLFVLAQTGYASLSLRKGIVGVPCVNDERPVGFWGGVVGYNSCRIASEFVSSWFAKGSVPCHHDPVLFPLLSCATYPPPRFHCSLILRRIASGATPPGPG